MNVNLLRTESLGLPGGPATQEAVEGLRNQPVFAVYNTIAARNAEVAPRPTWCLVRANGFTYRYDLDIGIDEDGGGWVQDTLPGINVPAPGPIPGPASEDEKFGLKMFLTLAQRDSYTASLNGAIDYFVGYVDQTASFYAYNHVGVPGSVSQGWGSALAPPPHFAIRQDERTKLLNAPSNTNVALAEKAPMSAGVTTAERNKLLNVPNNTNLEIQAITADIVGLGSLVIDQIEPRIGGTEQGVADNAAAIANRALASDLVATNAQVALRPLATNVYTRAEVDAAIAGIEVSGGGNITRLVHGGVASFPRGVAAGFREWLGWVEPVNRVDGDTVLAATAPKPTGLVIAEADGVMTISFDGLAGIQTVEYWRYATETGPDDLGTITGSIAYSATLPLDAGRRQLTVPFDESMPFVRLRFRPSPLGRDTAAESLKYASDPSDEVEVVASVPGAPVATLAFFTGPTNVVADPVATQAFVIDVSGLGAFGSGSGGAVLQAQWSFQQLIDGVWEPHTTGITYSLNNTRATVVTTFPDVETSGLRATFDTAGGGVDATATRSVVVSAPSSAAPAGNFFWDFEEASGNWIDALSSLAIPRGATTRESGPTGNHCLTTSAKVTVAQTLRTNHLEDPIYIAAFVFADQWGDFAEGDIGLGNFRISLGRDFARLHFVRDEVFEGSWSTGGLNSEPLRATAIGWYFIEGYYNPATDLAGLAVNGSAFVTVPATSVARDGGAIQLNQSVARRLDKLFISNVIPSADERAWLYNTGAGRTGAEVAA